MKKSLFYIATAALALVSCNEEELVNAPVSQAKGVLTATFNQDAATRTSIDGNNKNALTWSTGDAIAVFSASEEDAVTVTQYTLSAGDGSASGTFTGAEILVKKLGAVFPFSDKASLKNGVLSIELPNDITQTGSELDVPMWGEIKDDNISFKHLAGLLKVNLTGILDGYKKLTVTADKPISGAFTATLNGEDEEPVLTAASDNTTAGNTVTVTFTAATSENKNAVLYLPLPTGKYESIVVSVSNADGTNSKVLKQFSGINVERAKVYSTSADISTYVTTAEELVSAVANANIATINLGGDISMSEILTINRSVTINGNGYALTSSATRAINIETDGEVKVKNLIVTASGERAFNVINQPAKLTLTNVTATAKNYAVMVATTAGQNATSYENAAKLTVNNSDLTGLNVVNIAGAYTEVAITNTNLTCNDQSDKESYAAISVYSTGNDVKVQVNGGTITVNGDSYAAFNIANNVTIGLSGSTCNGTSEYCEHIEIGSCYITYANQTAYGFKSLEDALGYAKGGETIYLAKDVILTNTLTVANGKNITLDLNGKTITIGKENEATEVTDFKNLGTMTIQNGSIYAGDNELTRRCIYNYGTMIIDGVNFTQLYGQKGAAINNEGTMTIQGETTVNSKYYSIWNSGNGAQLTVDGGTFTCDNIDDVTTPCYCVNNLSSATLTVNDGSFTGDHGAIALAGEGTKATLNKGTFECTGVVGQCDHVIYVPAGTELTYSESNCTFVNTAQAASDAGGKQIYNKGTVTKQQ